jgi:putative protein kinase ArgK-like GTPase of G3E family
MSQETKANPQQRVRQRTANAGSKSYMLNAADPRNIAPVIVTVAGAGAGHHRMVHQVGTVELDEARRVAVSALDPERKEAVAAALASAVPL